MIEPIITIHEDDDIARPEITIAIAHDSEGGWGIVASNGDDVSLDRPRSREDCLAYIEDSWGSWATCVWL
jgi:hypothetical protein